MQNVNYRNAYNSSGTFNKELFFLETIGVIPSVAIFEFESGQYDLKQITNELLSDLFPDNKFIRMYNNFSFVKTSCIPKLDNELYIGGEWIGIGITILCTNLLWEIQPEAICIYYDPKYSITEIRNKCDELVKRLPKADKTPKAAEVKLVAYDRDYYTINSSVKKVELDIDSLYNDDFKSVHEDIVKFISERNSGLIVMRGKKGTGKTSYIRALTSNYPGEYIIITNAVASHLANPEFISFMIEHKDSIFILEDCEQILMDRSENTFGGAIANILNMTDGLMSDIFNVKFICTFNAEIEKIDPALLRKGRCFANYEFKELCADKVEKLAKKHNIKLNEVKSMTLADLFNYEDTNCEVQKPVKRKIGF